MPNTEKKYVDTFIFPTFQLIKNNRIWPVTTCEFSPCLEKKSAALTKQKIKALHTFEIKKAVEKTLYESIVCQIDQIAHDTFEAIQDFYNCMH